MTPIEDPDELADLFRRLEKHDSFKATEKYGHRVGTCIWLGAFVWHDMMREVSIFLIVVTIAYLIWTWRKESKIHDEMTRRQVEEHLRFMGEYHQKRHCPKD